MSLYCEWCHQGNEYLAPELKSKPIGSQPCSCPKCHRGITLVSINRAMEVVQKSRQTIYVWMDDDRIRYIRDARGRRLICLSSLFLPPADEDDQDREKHGTLMFNRHIEM